MNEGMTLAEMTLKLLLPGQEAEAAVLACLQENGYTVEDLDAVRRVDTYLDTFDWLLMKNGLSLRYRISNSAAAYRLANIGPVEDGIARGMETEIPIDEPVDVPTAIPVKRIRKLVDGIVSPRKLIEQFQVRTDRRRYRVISPEGAEVEFCFDTSGFLLKGIRKRRRTRKLDELDAELLTGPDTALEALFSLLSKRFQYPLSRASKFEVAIERFKIAVFSKKPPEKLRVRLDDRIDLAIRKALTHQFQRFREQLPGVLLDIDTEFVHQARVAVRRIRSGLRLFRGAIAEATADSLGGELRWLGGLFGAVRDLDVFLLNLSRFEGKLERFPAKKKQAFENWVETRRRGVQNTLCEAFGSARYKTLERRIAMFLERPLPSRPRAPLAAKTVREIAPVLLMDKFETVIKQGAAVLARPKLKEFHRLRIQMKRFRYACEFMAPAYEDALDSIIERSVAIQDCLGELQDTVFTRNFVDSLCEEWRGKAVDPDLLFILGEIYQLQAAIARERREAFARIWEPFFSEETAAVLKEILFGQGAAK